MCKKNGPKLAYCLFLSLPLHRYRNYHTIAIICDKRKKNNKQQTDYGIYRNRNSRCIYYQEGEYSQAKLVRVIKGKVIDVAVDLRKNSPTFGHHVMVELSEENKQQLVIPRGFAHGFLVLSEEAIFTYKVDNIYAPQHEASIRWNDETLGIEWPIDPDKVITSAKDLAGKSFKEAKLFE